ncbi:hypothetical protein [Sphaerospermopsis sp. LEGE 00249]|uniref:hypothetical protein n=1 Tax=Sphaerospermopsis sp. LEGE 00249 TaxID=1380707 RepID=UPI001C9B05B5|nr:hypothetical protein [Sphaerospermopsis sp. LEGE 00249]
MYQKHQELNDYRIFVDLSYSEYQEGRRQKAGESKYFLFPQSPVTSHQSPVTSHQSPVTSHQSPVTNHQSPITSHQSPVTSHQFPKAMPNVTECKV